MSSTIQIDANNEALTAAWCHRCRSRVQVASPSSEDTFECPDCGGAFVELLEGTSSEDIQNDPETFFPPIFAQLMRNASRTSARVRSSSDDVFSSSSSEISSSDHDHMSISSDDRSDHEASWSPNHRLESSRPQQERDERTDRTSDDTAFLSEIGNLRTRRNESDETEESSPSTFYRNLLRLRLRQTMNRLNRFGGAEGGASLLSMLTRRLALFPDENDDSVHSVSGEDSNRSAYIQMGDYVIGDMTNVINQLMNHDNGAGAVHTTAKNVLDHLPFVTEEIAANSVHSRYNEDCAVCRSRFPWSKQASESSDDDESTISEESDAEEKNIWALPCGHWFHQECGKPWLEEHNTCPICRKQLPTSDEDYNATNCLSVHALIEWREAFLVGDDETADAAAAKVVRSP